MLQCVECDARWVAKEVIKGEIVTCPECGVELEVVDVNPVKLELAPQEEEDWGE